MAATGSRAAIVFRRASGSNRAEAVFWFQHDDPQAASCLAFLAEITSDVADRLEPIVGSVELGAPSP